MVTETTVLCVQCGREHTPFAIPKYDNDQGVIKCDAEKVVVLVKP